MTKHPRSRWFPQFAAVLTSICTLSSGLAADDPMACLVREYFYNNDRYVFGPVNGECSPSWHSVPFGNWGVDSHLGEPVDGQQFMGWARISTGDPDREWNSCTSQYPPPNPFYYNADGDTTQRSYEGSKIYFHTDWPIYPSDACGVYDYQGLVLTSSTNYHHIYELDAIDGNDYIGSAYFPELNVTMPCPHGSNFCVAESGWAGPYAVHPNILTASIKSVVHFESVPRNP